MNMDSFVNTTLNLSANANDLYHVPSMGSNDVTFAKWVVLRLRIFLYLSDPYEEMYEFQHQVPDYHTEVSLSFDYCILLRFI